MRNDEQNKKKSFSKLLNNIKTFREDHAIFSPMRQDIKISEIKKELQEKFQLDKTPISQQKDVNGENGEGENDQEALIRNNPHQENEGDKTPLKEE